MNYQPENIPYSTTNYQMRLSKMRNTQQKQKNNQMAISHQQLFMQNIIQWENQLQSLILQLTSLAKRMRRQSNKQETLERTQTLLKKIQLQRNKYRQAVQKIRSKIVTVGGLNSLKDYLFRSHAAIVKQVLQLLNISKEKKMRSIQKYQCFKKIKDYENQIEQQWQNLKGNNRNLSKGGNNKQNVSGIQNLSNTTNLYNEVSRQNISKAAIEQLHKEFLAIRMISYKMYQNYSDHNHETLNQELRFTKQEQQKLAKQISQMKKFKMQLQSEEKKITSQLNEIKRRNQLIGRRYFIQKSRIQTNFTTD